MSLLDPKLLAFFTVVKTGTINGSAKILKITQTGVTQRIRALERQLSVTLFVRSRSGMRPTAEGEALFRYCKEATDLEGLTMGAIQGKNPQLNIAMTIAGPTSVMSSRIVPSCLHLYSEFPFLSLNHRLDDNENRVDLLKKGLVEFAILSPEEVVNEMDSKMIKPDRYVLVCAAKWKNRRLQEVIENEKIIDFYESDETTLRYLKKFDLHAKAKKSRLFANTNDTIIQLFKEGIGYGTLTLEVAKAHIEAGDLITLNQRATMDDAHALAWYPRPEMPAYFKEIIRAIK